MTDPRKKLEIALCKLCEEKSFDKISVKELVNAAKVSRQTFYKYFDDKYDLALWVYKNDVVGEALSKYKQKLNYNDLCMGIFSAVKKRPKLYSSLFSCSDGPDSFVARFHQFTLDFTCDAIGSVNVTRDLLPVIDSWVAATDRILIQWIVAGMKTDLDTLTELTYRILPAEIKHFFPYSKN